MSGPWAALVVTLWVTTLILAVVVLGLVRKVEQLVGNSVTEAPPFPDVGGPPLGERPPEVNGYRGLAIDTAPQTPRLVLFLSSTCGVCLKLAEELNSRSVEGSGEWPGHVDLLLVTDPAWTASVGELPTMVVKQHDQAVSRRWKVSGTPFAVAVSAEGKVAASSFALNVRQLAEMASAL